MKYVIVMECLPRQRHLYEGIHPICFSSHCAVGRSSSLRKTVLKVVHGLRNEEDAETENSTHLILAS